MLKKIFICLFALTCVPINAYAVKTSANATVLIDAVTRQIIYSDNAEKKMAPASTTKIMTALIAIEQGNLNEKVIISKNAEGKEGSSIYLKAGDEVTLNDLLYGLMLNSGNDAATAIAEYIGGNSKNFAKMMNERVKEMGCKDTNFVNPSGLPEEGHYSTAQDMAVIMSYAMENTVFAEIVSTKEYTISANNSNTYLRNHNKLLWKYPDCVGGKTGYTKAGGRCLVSYAKRGDIPLICVTFDDSNDWSDHVALFDMGFEKVESKNIIKKNDILCTRSINGEKVNILSNNDFSLPLVRKTKITCKIYLKSNLPREITTGTDLGYAEVYCGKYKAGKVELKSGQRVKRRRSLLEYINIFRHSM